MQEWTEFSNAWLRCGPICGLCMCLCACVKCVYMLERDAIQIKQTRKTPVRLLKRSSTLELSKPVPDTKGMSILKGILAEIWTRIQRYSNNSQSLDKNDNLEIKRWWKYFETKYPLPHWLHTWKTKMFGELSDVSGNCSRLSFLTW